LKKKIQKQSAGVFGINPKKMFLLNHHKLKSDVKDKHAEILFVSPAFHYPCESENCGSAKTSALHSVNREKKLHKKCKFIQLMFKSLKAPWI
jgi:hypothetical protein